MEWLLTVLKPASIVLGFLSQGTNKQVLSVFDTVPGLIGNNLYMIMIGLFLLKWLAKKTKWAGDDKISTMLSGFVSLVMSGGFTKENITRYLEGKGNVSDSADRPKDR